MMRVKELVIGVQATFNLGNYQSIKVSRHETVEVPEGEEISLVGEKEIRDRIIQRMKEDAKVYAQELFRSGIA